MVTNVDQDELAAWHELLRACLEDDASHAVFSQSRSFGWMTDDEFIFWILASSERDALWNSVRQLYICFLNLAEGFDF